MIVFDENIHQQNLMSSVARWYRGRVLSLRDLRPGTFIEDEAIPNLLHQLKEATFVSTNVTDFWRRTAAHARYCIVCLPLRNDQLNEVPELLRRLFRLPQFQTKNARMGKVMRVSERQIQYYEAGKGSIQTVKWPD